MREYTFERMGGDKKIIEAAMVDKETSHTQDIEASGRVLVGPIKAPETKQKKEERINITASRVLTNHRSSSTK